MNFIQLYIIWTLLNWISTSYYLERTSTKKVRQPHHNVSFNDFFTSKEFDPKNRILHLKITAEESKESIMKKYIKLLEISCSHSLLAIQRALQSMHDCNYTECIQQVWNKHQSFLFIITFKLQIWKEERRVNFSEKKVFRRAG